MDGIDNDNDNDKFTKVQYELRFSNIVVAPSSLVVR